MTEPVVCPACDFAGQKSMVYVGGAVTTLAHCPPFYDEDGCRHHHDSNKTTEDRSCSNGHRWSVVLSPRRCWCGWPDDARNVPTKEERPMASEGGWKTGPGALVVVEGIDGVGKTTQVARLVAALRARGTRAHGTREPSDRPVGRLIRQALGRELYDKEHDPGGDAAWSPTPVAMALLFAADRADHVAREVSPRLADGVVVVCDRYWHSSLAYQVATGAGREVTADWILALNRNAPDPDLTIVLDAAPEVAAARRAGRASSDAFERDAALQARLAAAYRDMPRLLPRERFEYVGADRGPDEVHDEMLAALARRGLAGPA